MDHFFASATRDESWRVAQGESVLLERRAETGGAVARGSSPVRLTASDDLRWLCSREGLPDPPADLMDRAELSREFVETQLGVIRNVIRGRAATVRFVRSGRSVYRSAAWHPADASAIVVTLLDAIALSAVSAPETLAGDCRALDSLASRGAAERVDYRDFPIVWRCGSAGVLLHEAAGHPSENAAPPVQWPSWLSVADEPENAWDDAGKATQRVDLLRSAPASVRRESFRDVPRPRMTRLVVAAGPEASIPTRRIEVMLVGDGAWDSLSDRVTLRIDGADLVRGSRRTPLQPFVYEEVRARVAASLAGTAGSLRRYPGVVCSREGQRLFVDTFAPDLLTLHR